MQVDDEAIRFPGAYDMYLLNRLKSRLLTFDPLGRNQELANDSEIGSVVGTHGFDQVRPWGDCYMLQRDAILLLDAHLCAGFPCISALE